MTILSPGYKCKSIANIELYKNNDIETSKWRKTETFYIIFASTETVLLDRKIWSFVFPLRGESDFIKGS